MDGSEGGSRYLSNYGENHGYGSTRMKVLGRNVPQRHSQLIADTYVDEDDELQEDDDEEEEEEEEEANDGDGQMNGSGQPNGVYVDNDDGDDDTDDNDNSNNNGNNNNHADDDGDGGGEDDKRIVSYNLHKHPKKRKLKSLLSSFELAPRAPPPLAILPPPATKTGGRNTLTDWSEHETFVLLDAWGERFLQRGRKSLRSEEWQEVAEKVSRQSKLERTDTQCRNRLDTLKKKYKKEKALLESNTSLNSKWVYFKKMNMLMAGTPPQPSQPPPPRANGLNGMRMRDSPDDTNSQDGYDDEDDDDLDILPPKKSKYKGGKVDGVSSFKLLADSINRFSDTYEKIENSKRKQMLELEKMRMEFYKDLELQKMKILDRARDEIAKIRQGDHEENDDSAENLRG